MIEAFKDDIVKILFNIKIQTRALKNLRSARNLESKVTLLNHFSSSNVSIETSSLAHRKKSMLLQAFEQKGLNFESISTIFLQPGQVRLIFEPSASLL